MSTPPRASWTSSPCATTSPKSASSPRAAQNSELFRGIHVAIVGDIANSRVARSNIHGLCKLGARITLVGPSTLVPGDIRRLSADYDVNISHDLDSVLPTVDVVNMLRVQFERLTSAAFPSIREYSRFFGLTRERLAKARDDLLVLHPGPMNRQVSNGLAVRMAVLFLCVGANSVARRPS